MTSSQSTQCRICQSTPSLFYQEQRTFYKCPDCHLIFSRDLPQKSVEEKHYKDQWGKEDADFWKSQVDTLLLVIQNYKTPEYILDFGSGSGEMTREFLRRGYNTTGLEPMTHGYLNEQNYLQRFDVVVAVEVIEHLPDVWRELREIEKVLSPGGIVVFSTLLTNPFIDLPDAVQHFKNWWYKDDPTHLSFFCNRTLAKMADMGHYDIDIIQNNLFVLKKESPS